MACQGIRGHILGCVVDARPFRFMLGPIGGKYLKCFSSKKQVEWPAHLLSHYIAKKIIKVRNGPSTIREVATGIFGWPTRSLHHAVKGDKRQDNNFSHA